MAGLYLLLIVYWILQNLFSAQSLRAEQLLAALRRLQPDSACRQRATHTERPSSTRCPAGAESGPHLLTESAYLGHLALFLLSPYLQCSLRWYRIWSHSPCRTVSIMTGSTKTSNLRNNLKDFLWRLGVLLGPDQKMNIKYQLFLF